MSSHAGKRLEAWLMLAGMLAAIGWYARPQLGYSLRALRELANLILRTVGG